MEDLKGLENKECKQIGLNNLSDEILIDVRSPKEYSEAHAVDAISIPLMDNYQRHIVGKTYKQESKDAAIDKAWKMFNPAVNEYISKFNGFKDRKIAIYCWRGGMRSRLVVNLLNHFGFDAVQVIGGYKSYMKHVWEELDYLKKEYSPRFIVLYGNTGTRKTEILKKLAAEGYPVLDLEGLAQHRASVYGGVGLEPRSQKMFSILLLDRLKKLNDNKFIFVEGESNKIGNIIVPDFVIQKIKDSIKINVTARISTRVNATIKEYEFEKNIEELKTCTRRLLKIIGKKNVEMLIEMLDSGNFEEFTRYMLEEYYDKKYIHGKMDYDYALAVNSDDIDKCVDELIRFYEKLL